LQALREEEEKIAEEEAVEDVPITYDRPDLCNKVTLRRSSTGLWKVCSSGPNPKSQLSHSVKEKGESCKLECKDAKNEQVLRSSKSCSEDVKKTSVTVNGDFNGGDYKLIKHLKGVTVSRFSPTYLRNHTELSSDLPTTSGVLESDESFAETEQQREASRKCSSSPAGDFTRSPSVEGHCNSTVNHKYPTRQKSAHHVSDSVL
jgi:hypothetical protein